MRFSRFTIPSVLALLLVAVAPANAANAATSEAKAKALIVDLSEEVISSLTAKDITTADRRTQFKEVMDKYFAGPTIARFVLGRHWRRATKEQQTEYMQLFENMVIERYVDSLAEYSGEKLEVGRVDVRSERDLLVESKVTRPGATQAVDVKWRVAVAEDTYKIVDVFVNGLSLAVTQQKEFDSVIRNNSNSVEALLEKMRARDLPAVSESATN